MECEPHELEAGEYCNYQGIWYGVPPGTDLLAAFTQHNVTEHDDGRISVNPSILVKDHQSRWHGYLHLGAWRMLE